MGFYVFEESPTACLLLSCIDSVQLPTLSKNGTWYLGALDDVKSLFNAFSLSSHLPDNPEWTLVRNRTQSRGYKDQNFEMGR